MLMPGSFPISNSPLFSHSSFLSLVLVDYVLACSFLGNAPEPPPALADKKDTSHQDGGAWVLMVGFGGSLTHLSSNISTAPPWVPEIPTLPFVSQHHFPEILVKTKYSA